METWQQALAVVVPVLGLLGGGVRWLLTWVLAQVRDNQERYVKALNDSEDRFTKALHETEARFASVLVTKDVRIDTERDARLADQRQHTEEMREMLDQFNSTLVQFRARSLTPPPR